MKEKLWPKVVFWVIMGILILATSDASDFKLSNILLVLFIVVTWFGVENRFKRIEDRIYKREEE